MHAEFSKRLVSLDTFRGVTIAGMIVVNNLSAWSDTPRSGGKQPDLARPAANTIRPGGRVNFGLDLAFEI